MGACHTTSDFRWARPKLGRRSQLAEEIITEQRAKIGQMETLSAQR
jgi:uncharacterized protein (DUF305 family)